jgi:ABC-type polysaccharide transport system permease subunit
LQKFREILKTGLTKAFDMIYDIISDKHRPDTEGKKMLIRKLRQIRTDYVFYLLLLPAFVYILVFNYVPMYGVQIAFKNFMANIGNEPVFFFGKERYFRHLYVWSGVWQSTGFNSIIYISVLAGVSQEMHEAAIVDGASKFKRILYIDLPSILPTAVVLLILSIGQMMSIGFDKVYLMQNSINLPVSEIISTLDNGERALGSRFGKVYR